MSDYKEEYTECDCIEECDCMEEETKTNEMVRPEKEWGQFSLWSVVCGCAGFILIGIFGSLLGYYFAHKAEKEGDLSEMQNIGKILSIAGLIYNCLLIVFAMVLCWMLFGVMIISCI